MKIFNAIVLVVVVTLFGCGRVSPEGKAELNQFRSGLSTYLHNIQSNQSPEVMYDQFYLLLDSWEKIKEKHILPSSSEKRINSGLYYYKYVLVSNQSLEDMHPFNFEDMDSANESQQLQARTTNWEVEARKAYNQIDSRFWSILKSKHEKEGGTNEDFEYLELLSKDMTYRGPSDIMTMIKFYPDAIELVFKELNGILDN